MMMKQNCWLLNPGGFTYLAVMATIVITGILLSAVSYQWKMISSREKEKELLFRGGEIRNAIRLYVETDPLRRYPHSLEDLIKDPRSPKTVRYLRKVYSDPMTEEEWSTIVDPARGLVGVHSKSKTPPVKTANFSFINRCFEGKTKYSEWLFIYQPIILQVPMLPPQQGNSAAVNAGASTLAVFATPCPAGSPPTTAP